MVYNSQYLECTRHEMSETIGMISKMLVQVSESLLAT